MTDPASFRSRYQQMWEEFGREKAKRYNARKFTPINRVGLTNLVREERVLKLVKMVPHDTVLDIGCASGRQVFALAPHCRHVTGVDIAESFVQECEEQRRARGVENVDFLVATFDDLPETAYDVVLCGEVLEHVIDLDADMRRMTARVRPGGHVVVTTPHYNGDGTWWGRLMRLAGVRRFTPLEHFSMGDVLAHGDAHVREFSRKTLVGLMESYGCVVRDIRTVSHIDGPWCDVIVDGLLERIPWTRRVLVGVEHVKQVLLPALGRHIVLLARKC